MEETRFFPPSFFAIPNQNIIKRNDGVLTYWHWDKLLWTKLHPCPKSNLCCWSKLGSKRWLRIIVLGIIERWIEHCSAQALSQSSSVLSYSTCQSANHETTCISAVTEWLHNHIYYFTKQVDGNYTVQYHARLSLWIVIQALSTSLCTHHKVIQILKDWMTGYKVCKWLGLFSQYPMGIALLSICELQHLY